MPMLIRTMNQIQREERKDLYFVKFAHEDEGWSEDDSAARQCLLQWLKDNLPNTKTELMAPDGMLDGGIDSERGPIRIDFDEASLATFCATWEEADGKSRDAHFQCYIRPFEDWRAGIAHCMPSFERPVSTKACWFWDTPKGFLHHATPEQDADDYPHTFIVDTANPDDVWFLAGELAPEWRDTDMADFVGGRITYNTQTQQWSVEIGFTSLKHFDHYQRNDDYRMNPENQRRICEWFGLVPERVVFEEFSYF